MPDSDYTLIISDTHLGSRAVYSKNLLNLLDSARYDRLIILGDLFDHFHIKKLKPIDWQFLSRVKGVADSGIEVVWVKGNHDREFPHRLPELKGVKICEEYAFSCGGKKYIAIHGDQFDVYIKNKTAVNAISDRFDKLITAMNAKNKLVMSTLGLVYGAGLRLSKIVAEGAMNYASKKNVDCIICGHTHDPLSVTKNVNGKEISYLNSGSWARSVEWYVTVDPEHGAYISENTPPASSRKPLFWAIARRKRFALAKMKDL